MGINEMKMQYFPSFSIEEWKEKAEESLKGKPIETLQKTTYEGIFLKPLYCAEDLKIITDLPASEDFRRGTQPFGYQQSEWKISQNIKAVDAEILKEKLASAFERGQTAISVEVSKSILENPEMLVSILMAYCDHHPFAIDANKNQEALVTALAKRIENRDKITGYIAADPVASYSISGSMPQGISEFFRIWAQQINQTSKRFPNLKTVLVNTTPYHNGGANAVQELGIAAATGVFYLQTLLENGMELEKALAAIVFQFSIGAHFFTEIAKLRAARIIWSKIAEAFGAEPAARGMEMAAETSSYTKTIYDPTVNLLRAGNEAFAAVLGGIQYLHVSPYDDLTSATAFSERIARNTQLILQEEMSLQNVVDPAGGSWYIESLTNELAEKAWTFFQQIEAKGGILEALKSNWLQEEIVQVQEKRAVDIFIRKTSVIGTNVYANLAEKVISAKKVTEPVSAGQQETISIQPVPQTRLSIPFESLRYRAEALVQKPAVGLICLGSLKQHKPRLDFVKGFLAAGGIYGIASEEIFSEEDAEHFVSTSETKHFCFCGSDDLYETLGVELLQSLKQQDPERIFYLAGSPDKEKQLVWQKEGIAQFIHRKSNCYETLSVMLTEMEVALNEQAKA